MLERCSFRQLLFVAFGLIALLIGASSVQALLTLERLARLGRETAAQTVLLAEQAQRLAERTQAMERSARQFMVLDEAVFRDRYVEAWTGATAALAPQAGERARANALADEWRAQAQVVWLALNGARRQRRAGQAALERVFARLPVINAELAARNKADMAGRNDSMLGELERQRQWLTAIVAGALLLSAILASWFGTWLARPLRRIEQAIGRLGENRFDEAVAVGGPADMRRLGGQLDWLRRRLAALDDDQQRFVRHISHELKTPLAALREGVALLGDEVAGALTPGQREIVGILGQNSASLQTQIEDLLRYNTAVYHAQHLRRASVDVLALLRKVVDDQRLQWQARALRVSVRGAAAPLLADADKLSVALANMLSNALRFSPAGGRVELLLASDAAGVRIDVIDQGPGVAAVDAARIFEPFYQGRQPAGGARKGNGIGLSIVREYIAAHGGSVALIARPHGAHFRIELPHEK